MIYGVYLVTGKRQYRGHDPGTEFEAILDPSVEARAVGRGDIQLLRRMEPDLIPGSFQLPEGWDATPQEPPDRVALSIEGGG